MKLWTWQRLAEEFEKHPDQLRQFNDHPPKGNCATFAEVLAIDEGQCDITAEIIGCRCPENMKQQQTEAMAVRQAVWNTPREWLSAVEGIAGSIPPDYDTTIRKITQRYARAKRCHRNWIGQRAGIRCYCDEHGHGNSQPEKR